MRCHEQLTLLQRDLADAIRVIKQHVTIGQCYTGRIIAANHECAHCGSVDPQRFCPKGFLGVMVVDFTDYDERG